MLIAYSGTHSTGKSSSVYKEAYEMKLSHKNESVAVLMENAKHSPYKINKTAEKESQLWIFANQLQEELKLLATYDIVICDRTICDSIAYTRINNNGDYYDMSEAMIEIAKHHIEKYDVIHFKTIENNDYLVEDGVRDHLDPIYRVKIERELLKIYNELGKCSRFNLIME